MEGSLVIAQPELQQDLHEGGEWALLVDGHADASDTGICLGQQGTAIFLVARGNVAGIGLGSSEQGRGPGIITRGEGRLGEAKGHVPAVGRVIGP